jgi:hypothetical protein
VVGLREHYWGGNLHNGCSRRACGSRGSRGCGDEGGVWIAIRLCKLVSGTLSSTTERLSAAISFKEDWGSLADISRWRCRTNIFNSQRESANAIHAAYE